MSVRSLARARLQMTALLGSGARWPHLSSWLKPLEVKKFSCSVSQVLLHEDLPRGKHLDQMLLRAAGLVTFPQARKDSILPKEDLARRTLDFDHLSLVNVRSRRDYVKVQVLPKYDDASAVLQHVPRRVLG